MTKNILILGSSHLVEPLIDFLLKNKDNHIFLASNDYFRCEEICFSRKSITPIHLEIDIIDESKNQILENFIKQSDLVIPFIPSKLHSSIAKICIQYKKNMIISNLLEDNLRVFEQSIIENKLIFITEVGLQPGLDHFICKKIISDVYYQSQGQEEVIGYEFWSTALPFPENIKNPIRHKFSYSPKLNLLGLNQDTHQLIDGKVVKINNMKQYLHKLNKQSRFHPSLNLEGIYIGDCREFKDKHKLNNFQNIIQGTLRYKGYIFITQCFKFLKLFSFKSLPERYIYWKDYFFKNVLYINELKEDNSNDNLRLILDKNSIQPTIKEMDRQEYQKFLIKKNNLYEKYIKGKYLNVPYSKSEIGEKGFYFDLALTALAHFDNKYFKNQNIEKLFEHLYSSLLYLDLYNEKISYNSSDDNVFDLFCSLLESKISLSTAEPEFVFIQTKFTIQNKFNLQKKIMYYNLMKYGKSNNSFSAISLLVGIPTGVIAQMVLNNEIKENGLIIPSGEEVLNKVFECLEENNIIFKKSYEVIAKF